MKSIIVLTARTLLRTRVSLVYTTVRGMCRARCVINNNNVTSRARVHVYNAAAVVDNDPHTLGVWNEKCYGRRFFQNSFRSYR